MLIFLPAFAGQIGFDRSEGAQLFKVFAILLVLLSPFGLFSFLASKSLVLFLRFDLFLPGQIEFINSKKAFLLRFVIWEEVKEKLAARGAL